MAAEAAQQGPETSLEEWLRAGPFTLALCSSFFGYYAHAGVLEALEEAGISPAKVCGSSSGSVISTLWAGGLSARTEIRQLLLELKREQILHPFWESPGAGFFRINDKFLSEKAPISRLESGKIPVAISTFNLFTRRTVVWTQGDAGLIVAASCAIPLIMQPVWLDGQIHVDGGVKDLLGLASCGATERVLSIDLSTMAIAKGRTVHKAMLGTQDNAEPLQNCVKLQLTGLPFVGPTTMERGAEAMDFAQAAMRRALSLRSREWGDERIFTSTYAREGDLSPAPAVAAPVA